MPVWSPDGRYLAFFRAFREPELVSEICLIPATGGPPRVLLRTEGLLHLPGLAWWEDRNALLFSTRRPTATAFQLAALDLATLDVRFLTEPPPAPLLTAPGDFLPAVAPDRRTLAFVRETHEGRDVFLLDLVTGIERRVTHDHHRITGLTWSPDGQAVITSAIRGGVEALYRVAVKDGTTVRVPNTNDWATQPNAERFKRLSRRSSQRPRDRRCPSPHRVVARGPCPTHFARWTEHCLPLDARWRTGHLGGLG
jgi:Tol biopolymer transport system component